MQIETTMRIHFRLTRMVIIKQTNNRKKQNKIVSAGEDAKELEPS